MSHHTRFVDLPECRQRGLALAVATLEHSLNIPQQTRIAAVAETERGHYPGASLRLGGVTGVHAEQAAIAHAHSAGDRRVHTLYLATRRFDDREPAPVTPCGGCRQLICDLATHTGVPITVLSIADGLSDVLVVQSTELLPHAFTSRTLTGRFESN